MYVIATMCSQELQCVHNSYNDSSESRAMDTCVLHNAQTTYVSNSPVRNLLFISHFVDEETKAEEGKAFTQGFSF